MNNNYLKLKFNLEVVLLYKTKNKFKLLLVFKKIRNLIIYLKKLLQSEWFKTSRKKLKWRNRRLGTIQ